MSYNKTIWNTGDVITAEKLNNMENGIACGTLVIGGFSYGDNGLEGTSDKTWQEIDNALAAGTRCFVAITTNDGRSQLAIEGSVLDDAEEEKYQIYGSHDFLAATASADGYPSIGSIG